jgi:hypothetical protein
MTICTSNITLQNFFLQFLKPMLYHAADVVLFVAAVIEFQSSRVWVSAIYASMLLEPIDHKLQIPLPIYRIILVGLVFVVFFVGLIVLFVKLRCTGLAPVLVTIGGSVSFVKKLVKGCGVIKLTFGTYFHNWIRRYW